MVWRDFHVIVTFSFALRYPRLARSPVSLSSDIRLSMSLSSISEKHPNKMRHVPWAQHALRQLKLLVPGAAMTYYLGTLDEFWGILHGHGGSLAQSACCPLRIYHSSSYRSLHIHRSAAFVVSLLGLTTIGLFLCVLFLPFLTGEEPDVRTSWIIRWPISNLLTVPDMARISCLERAHSSML